MNAAYERITILIIGCWISTLGFIKLTEGSGWIVSGVADAASQPPCQSLCINVYQEFTEGANVFLYPPMAPSAASLQQWTYDTQNLALSTQIGTGKVLCMQASTAGNLVTLQDCNNGTSQKWTFETEGSHFRTGDPASPLYLQANYSSDLGAGSLMFVDKESNHTITQFTVIPFSSALNIPALPSSNASNLIQNGGFDNLTFPYQDFSIPSKFLYSICGWIVDNDVNAVPMNYSGTSQGNYSIDLRGEITQTVPTYRGSEYLLLFLLANSNTCNSTVLQVQLDPSSLTSPQDYTLPEKQLDWQLQHLTFFALDGSLNLSFRSKAGNFSCSPVIDNVKLYILTNSIPVGSLTPLNTQNSARVHATHILGWIVAGFMIFILMSWSLYQYHGRHKRKAMSRRLADYQRFKKLEGRALKRYSLEELRTATKGFTDVIGRGGFAVVYRAESADGTLLAVKRDVRKAQQGTIDRFEEEMSTLLRVHHRYIVNFLGYCNEEGEHIMVVEYMLNGSLDRHLHSQPQSTLPWIYRMRIAFQVALGLEYLHHGANPPIVHRDVKSANILLDENFSAKVADFGLSKVGRLNASKVTPAVTAFKGTLGYVDPEYHQTFVLTEKSDVYSFGVVLLELISGRKAVQDNQRLDIWARELLEREEELHNLADESLQGSFNPDELRAVAEIASMCVRLESQQRPQMFEVVKLLRERLWVSLQGIVPVLLPLGSNATTSPKSFSMGSQAISAR